jgi:exodeoxyribonuclease VII small subunit
MTAEEKQPTFEEALTRLEAIVEQIESGQIGLEESIARYEQGIKLVAQCRKILDAAEKKIQLLAKGESGSAEPGGELETPGE